MKTVNEKEPITENQQQLAYLREKTLALIIEDMRIIKGYLCELKELRRELKQCTRLPTDATTEDYTNIALS